ncbi:hypothetical protein [Synechococcus sp. CC9311]|uniref:hypothetical protein n=1 Tax=Synechococcus sp. (strain CC9311) TaxID=64471 RepID=UPI0000DDB0C9|nr:hypothetical protein [Synechococcus sp. CC9311]ABI45899.1 hypothetical protein sync_2019 [Synechococcus sp. CC9311]
MDPEPARELSQQPSFQVAAPTLAFLGFIVAFTSLGIPLAAVLTDRPPIDSLTPLTAQDRHGSEVPASFSLSGATQSDR